MRIDLSTTYLGLQLAHPLVASASPLCESTENLLRLEQAGAAAVVLPSLFEEQIEHEEQELSRLQDFGTNSFPEALDYFPELADYNLGTDRYLRLIEDARRSLAIPVIASLNGATRGGWTRMARRIELAGAQAIELNVHSVPVEPSCSAEELEQQIVGLVYDVICAVGIPVAVKLGPCFSSLPHLAQRLVRAGASGLVLFNRFVQPDIDLETLEIVPRLVLSSSMEVRQPLMWIAILRDQLRISLGATSGVHTRDDVVKLLLAGSDAVLVASVLYQKGLEHIGVLRDGLHTWLAEHGYDSVRQMQGSVSRAHCANPQHYERVNYMKTLVSYTRDPDASS
jgi:dihydroorotate dehydrogenase (fumarate)